MRMFSVEYFNDKAVEEIKKTDGVYYSKTENAFCTTDQIMEQLIEKYNITTDEDLAEPEYQDKYNFTEHIYENIEEWIEWNYDQDVEFFGKSLYLPDYAESVKLSFEDDCDTGESLSDNNVDWAKEIDERLMLEVSVGLAFNLSLEVDRAVNAGFDLGIIKDAFSMVGIN